LFFHNPAVQKDQTLEEAKRYSHAPEQRNSTDDLEDTEQTRNTSKARVMSATSNIRLTCWQNHDIRHSTSSRDRA